MKRKIGTPEYESKALEILRNAKTPVSVGYVDLKLGVCWGTARAILFELTLKGKVKAQQTDNGKFFTIADT
jgi:hypothetical protein